MPRVLLATCAEAAGRDDDEPLLLAALADAGLTAAPADWADPGVDWAAADLVVVRSTWDYAPRRDEFLAWARKVAGETALLNPAEVLEWNTDKRYLGELADAGLPVVPTAWVTGAAELPAALARWDGDLVVKPVVSAGARDTARFPAAERRAAAAFAERILAGGRPVIVQPYLARLDAEGRPAWSTSTAPTATPSARAPCWPVLRSGPGCSPRRRSRPGRRPPRSGPWGTPSWPRSGRAPASSRSTPASTWCPATTAGPGCSRSSSPSRA
ncbi:ATP-grasp domain-containing protein [Geodermatophilus ruber]|uniref:ATP-grasp domain-containing protein n=1 Tax=Geodermatophilus ruber TaxID=504800 RepID=A0A1I4ITX1_9ACTN|nr:hypothetical protein [Geodermatophilus ruber]SFL57740.1 hypothetical protein SAMN04488085_113127 [Geodermatophilus ruber]